MKTGALIELLAQDAPVGRRFSAVLAIAALGGITVAVLAFALILHVRPDFAAMITAPRVVFKMAMAALLAILAYRLVGALGKPGTSLNGAYLALAALAVLLLLAVAFEMSAVAANDWEALWLGHNAVWCLTFIPILAAAPLAALLFALKQGAPARPALAGAAAGLCASGIGAALYALHCVDDSPFFVATWYGLATLIVTAIGALAGRTLLRW